MKILILPDSPWAIGKLSEAIVVHNPQHSFRMIYVHPRGVEEKIAEVREAAAWADVIHFQYWRSAEQLINLIPELKEKKTILTHHNQKNLLSCDWEKLCIKRHVVHTKKSQEILLDAGYEKVAVIQHGIDLSYFEYGRLPEKPMVGYCGRIVPWKGLKEIAQACYELGIPLSMMGKADKADYWDSIPPEVRNHIGIEFLNCPDEERREFYRHLTLYVGNSGDNHEEGPLGLLEAMASGVPVVTTPAGEAADIIEDGRNGVLIPFGDYEALKEAIKKYAPPSPETEELRKNGWGTVKTMDVRKMAHQYSLAYHDLNGGGSALVSVIVPTFNRAKSVLKILDALKNQTHKNLEILIADDGSTDATIAEAIGWHCKNEEMTMRYLLTGAVPSSGVKDYGLARARNCAAIEAQGEFLMFLDSRMVPDENAISEFLKEIWVEQSEKPDKVWLFGDKGAQKQSFVENFSFIRRDHFIGGGMCSERIDRYGGMSQELRERFKRQGFSFRYVGAAKAETIEKTSMANRRRDIVEMKLRLYKMGLT